MTTTDFPVPLAGPRDWRVPLARRLVLAIGWLSFAAGTAGGIAGVVMGIDLAWMAPAVAAAVALASLVVAPEPRPARQARDAGKRPKPKRRRREPIVLPGLWAPPAPRPPGAVDLLTSRAAAPRYGGRAAYEAHLRRP